VIRRRLLFYRCSSGPALVAARPSRLIALALVCMLLLAQALGLMHGVAHGHSRGHSLAQVFDPAAGNGAPWLAPLFSSHDGDPDCRLFDQASHGSAAPAIVSLRLSVVLPSLVFDISRCEALARWAALFDARGPPLTR
jgi:hypothetical protein